jgi:subtilisin family serine protease
MTPSRGFISRQVSLAILAVVSSSYAFANNGYVGNEVLIKYRDGLRRNRAFMEEIYTKAGATKVQRLPKTFGSFERLTINKDVETAIAELESNPAVEYVQPNYIIQALPTTLENDLEEPLSGNTNFVDNPAIAERPKEIVPAQVDPSTDLSYGLTKIMAPQAWNTTKGTQNVVVAVIDTGVDYNHEDLSFNMWTNPNPTKNDVVGWDFANGDALPYDDNNHGTHVAGIIGAVGENGIGTSGVNQRVSLMALKFLDSYGAGVTSDAVNAINYAVQNGAKIINASWGGYSMGRNKALKAAIQLAETQGVLFVAAAGNEGNDNDANPMYPASFQIPNILSVAATDSDDDMAAFTHDGSNYGATSVHLAAPGKEIFSTFPLNKYKAISGTSMAAPFVAGAAALLLAQNPSWTYTQLKERLLNTVDELPSLKGKTITGGRLNIARALGN